MTVENILLSNLHERMLPTRRGSNPQPPDHQKDEHPTEPPRPANDDKIVKVYSFTLIMISHVAL